MPRGTGAPSSRIGEIVPDAALLTALVDPQIPPNPLKLVPVGFTGWLSTAVRRLIAANSGVPLLTVF